MDPTMIKVITKSFLSLVKASMLKACTSKSDYLGVTLAMGKNDGFSFHEH